jgi:hypothetical protein
MNMDIRHGREFTGGGWLACLERAGASSSDGGGGGGSGGGGEVGSRNGDGGEEVGLGLVGGQEEGDVREGGAGALLAKELEVCISTVGVRHSCRDACGVIVQNLSAPPWKIVYSGDTRPCAALEAAGAGATLLIHEATFENGLDGEARNKLHSTTAEALRVGRNMGAYRTLLTHFSQRYAKLPVIKEVCTDDRAMIAFDLMCVDLSQLEHLPACCEPIARLGARENWGDELVDGGALTTL